MLRSEVGAVEVVRPAALVAGELRVPGDKSIAHRALLLAALAEGESTVSGIPDSDDIRATIACLRSLGTRLSPAPWRSDSNGSPAGSGRERAFHISPAAFTTPHGLLDCLNSGTTMRLLLGMLAGSRVSATLDGDASLRRRPMARVIEPLHRMGARVESDGGRAPLSVKGGRLQGRHHLLTVASAQVKSAILLAGLSASGPTTVVEPVCTRDHTERLLKAMGADIRTAGTAVELRPSHRPLQPLSQQLPGDFSSAAFWLAAGASRPGWSITVRGVGLNPSRTAFLGILEAMGADVQVDMATSAVEPVGSVRVVGRPLRPIELGADDVAAAIDEIPVLLALATQADGITTINGAAELRLKESDRLEGMVDGLARMGASVEQRHDGITVRGPSALRGATVQSHGDHRIVMAFAVAALVASSPTRIEGADSVAVSYPEFFSDLQEVVDVS
jgi:3-phosphoshikimate 1-carboxyvinyltransferase